MINFEDRLRQALEQGYDFSPTEVVGRAYEIVKSQMGFFIGFTLIYLVVSGIASSLAQAISPGLNNVISTILSALWIPGFFYAAHSAQKGEAISFNTFMQGHQKAGKLIGFQVLLGILVYLPLLPAIASLFLQDNIVEEIILMQEMAQEGEFYMPVVSSLSIILFAIGFAITLFLSVAYSLGQVTVVLSDFSVWGSLEASRKLVQQKFFTFVGFFFVILGINLLGALLLFVGMLVSIPVSLVSTYIVFADIFKLQEDDDQEQDLRDHFVSH
ncbi:hypothetical protein PPO43_02550 [Saprospira sp. CCB-QB6]|uniref:hypothetical protein n=1 Tax=Saprospira sp. CCB-QB6 TaxID=3023936 RepID=UPI00234BC11E|nr:hypothetical protein [Saprospira sp. CCB-QB6]WCL81980.1 hypothetical protein PPO43_02550 [Saprospira sp. CCB-QB6]